MIVVGLAFAASGTHAFGMSHRLDRRRMAGRDALLRGVAAAIAAGTLAGCAAPPPPPPVPPLEWVSAPPDRAVVYFFRPALDNTGHDDAPQLRVNGQPVGRMSWPSYTYVELLPGRHRAELVPLPGDGAAWRAQSRICAVAGAVYYAVIWNQAQFLSHGTVLPVWLPGGGVFPIFSGPSYQKGSVVLEMVQPELARESLDGLRKVTHALSAPLQPESPDCGAMP